MDSDKSLLIGILLVGLLIIGVIATICIGTYYYHKINIDNFQKTIKDLSDEQKCLHICGFQFDGYFENYKFCAEKCDRVSERAYASKEIIK